jgi:hypothetical protein
MQVYYSSASRTIFDSKTESAKYLLGFISFTNNKKQSNKTIKENINFYLAKREGFENAQMIEKLSLRSAINENKLEHIAALVKKNKINLIDINLVETKYIEYLKLKNSKVRRIYRRFTFCARSLVIRKFL